MQTEHGYTVENWLAKTIHQDNFAAGYWDDEEIEKQKGWYYLLEKSKVDELENSFLKKESNFVELYECLDFISNNGLKLEGNGMDLAGGILWTVPHFLKIKEVKHMFAVEYSEQRLIKQGSRLLNAYEIPKDKVTLALGSFYELKVPSESLDFLSIVAAVHHADHPIDLMKEIHRVLKPKGLLILPAELYVSAVGYLKFKIISFLPKFLRKKIWGLDIQKRKIEYLNPTIVGYDPTLGDHFFHIQHYLQLFKMCNFEVLYQKEGKLVSFVLRKL